MIYERSYVKWDTQIGSSTINWASPIWNQKQKFKNIYLKKTSYFFLKKKFHISGWMLTKHKFFYTPYTPGWILTKLKFKEAYSKKNSYSPHPLKKILYFRMDADQPQNFFFLLILQDGL